MKYQAALGQAFITACLSAFFPLPATIMAVFFIADYVMDRLTEMRAAEQEKAPRLQPDA